MQKIVVYLNNCNLDANSGTLWHTLISLIVDSVMSDLSDCSESTTCAGCCVGASGRNDPVRTHIATRIFWHGCAGSTATKTPWSRSTYQGYNVIHVSKRYKKARISNVPSVTSLFYLKNTAQIQTMLSTNTGHATRLPTHFPANLFELKTVCLRNPSLK